MNWLFGEFPRDTLDPFDFDSAVVLLDDGVSPIYLSTDRLVRKCTVITPGEYHAGRLKRQ